MFSRLTWKYAAGLVIIIASIHLIIAFWWGPMTPETIYYRNDAPKLMKLAKMRESTASSALADLRKFRRLMHDNSKPLFNDPRAKDLCVGIFSVDRGDIKFLTETVAALLTRTPWKLQDRVRMRIINMETDASQHKEANSLADLVAVESVRYMAGRDARSLSNGTFLKESLDYIAGLEMMASLQCRNYLILEDDALAAPNWFAQVESALNSVRAHLGENDQWLVLRLFSSFRFDSWDKDKIGDWFLLFGTAFGLSVLISVLLLVGHRLAMAYCWVGDYNQIVGADDGNGHLPVANDLKRMYPPKWKLPRWINPLNIVLMYAGVVSLLYVVGKWNVYPAQPGVSIYDPGFSCVANVYHHRSLLKAHDYMVDQFDHLAKEQQLDELPHKDRMLSHLRQAHPNWRHLILLPNLFQHIGYASSLHKRSAFQTTTISHWYLHNELPITFDPRISE